ncbi:MAG: class I SAM-dependent methyltransferase [Acidobacteria bacterium]|nr:class I SAM-dependent methyltransferase [Acidobacteriota bacterium]
MASQLSIQEIEQAQSRPDRAEAFAERMVGVVNDGCLALMVSVGHRTGLFETMAGRPPSTSLEIAEAAGLQERYVREWLGAMVLGRVVEHDPARSTYRLPSEHAASLTRAAGPDNLATISQYVALLGSVEDGIVECFRRGGGLPYSAYPRFFAIQSEDSGQVVDATLVQKTLPTFPDLQRRLEEGIDVADVGCGRGHAANVMARAFPRSRFVGYDISKEAIEAARAEAEVWGLANVRFEARDLATLDVFGRYDLVFAFDAIHDQVKPRRVLKNIARALRPGGEFMMVDIKASSHLHENHDHPIGVAFYTISTMHCMTVSLSEGGEGLGTMWGEQKARELLAEAGLGRVDVTEIEGDIQNLYYRARPA